VVVARPSGKIICVNFSEGRKHDFSLFKESRLQVMPSIHAVTDSGYVGIAKIHSNSRVPKKKSKNKPLTAEDRRTNRELARQRIQNEHVIGALKRFRIILDRYRNRRRRFGLRFNLIAGIYNHDLAA
jgi:hypothetical protein